jgi:hypothetical protein
MRIPNADKAVVDEAKVRDYLLSETHSVGKFKARFFASLGFTRENWLELATALRELAAHDAVLGQPSPFGQKFEVRASLQGPSGRVASLVVVWIVKSPEEFPRFVTAYPERSHERRSP